MVMSKRALEAFILDHRVGEKSLLLLEVQPKMAKEDYGAIRRSIGGGWRPLLEGIP